MMDGVIYLYAHNSGALSKVGLASDGDASGRKASYVAAHGLTGWDTDPEVFATGATTKRELYEIEQAIHDRLRSLGGAFWGGTSGPQEIFAVPPAVAREAIRVTLGGEVDGVKVADPVRDYVLANFRAAQDHDTLREDLMRMCRRYVVAGFVPPSLVARMRKVASDFPIFWTEEELAAQAVARAEREAARAAEEAARITEEAAREAERKAAQMAREEARAAEERARAAEALRREEERAAYLNDRREQISTYHRHSIWLGRYRMQLAEGESRDPFGGCRSDEEVQADPSFRLSVAKATASCLFWAVEKEVPMMTSKKLDLSLDIFSLRQFDVVPPIEDGRTESEVQAELDRLVAYYFSMPAVVSDYCSAMHRDGLKKEDLPAVTSELGWWRPGLV